MNFSKLEAAQRQMDCAIGLYFAERDEVSIHTLVGAAYLVLSDLSKAAKKDSPVDQYVKPEHRRKFEGAIRASQNFLSTPTKPRRGARRRSRQCLETS